MISDRLLNEIDRPKKYLERLPKTAVQPFTPWGS